MLSIVIAGSSLAYFMFETFRTIELLLDFDWYKVKTIAKIKKLGGNPANLDKEETEKQGESK